MGLTLWIPAEYQYRTIPPTEARQQTIIQAIKRNLFVTDAVFNQVLLEYTAALHKPLSQKTRQSVRDLWQTLVLADGNYQPELEFTQVEDIPKSIVDAFCYTVHGLCAALAPGWLDAASKNDVGIFNDEDENEDNEKNDSYLDPKLATTPNGETNSIRAEYRTALSAIAHNMHFAAQHLPDHINALASSAENERLVASISLDTLLEVSKEWFSKTSGDTNNLDGRVHTYKWIELKSPVLIGNINTLIAELPWYFTVQPLKKPVVYRLDGQRPADAKNVDYFHIDLFNYRRSNDFLREFHNGYQRPENRAEAFGNYLDAINLQQAVAWRINRPLLKYARHLCESVTTSSDEASPKVLQWAKNNFYTRSTGANSRKTYELSGDFLDSPFANQVLEALSPENGDLPSFYLPWKADYRGRIYAHTPWFTPQGGDLQRALLEFAKGHKLDDNGVIALCRHGVNLVKRARILNDLAITDRQVITLDEGVQWIDEHKQEILACAKTPLAEPFWCEIATKPMQFLAFCLAYQQWYKNKDAEIHLPVQIDGTCNGLQHIAALTGDEKLARAVNVLPSENGLPGDIYSELAITAADSLGKLAYYTNDIHQPLLRMVDQWLAESATRCGWINRDTAKKVVMTIPYGASESAQAGFVLEKIAKDFEQEWQTWYAPQQSLLDELDRCLSRKPENVQKDGERKKNKNSKELRRWIFVIQCSKKVFKSQRDKAFQSEDELTRALAYDNLKRMSTLAAYAALVIVKHLRAALTTRFASVDKFSYWLKQTAQACAGLPLLWISPYGVPVCQDKFELSGTSLSAGIGNRQVRIDLSRLGKKANSAKQKDALLPNFIHSLDATHLMITLNRASNKGITDIGTIHDCLLCHPNDAVQLGEVVRQAFVELYSSGNDNIPSPLKDWAEWMSIIARITKLRHTPAVLGALQTPDGMGERMLREMSSHDNDQQESSAHDLCVLEDIRKLDSPQRFFARLLLDYIQEIGQKQSSRRRKKPIVVPIAQGLPLTNAQSLSDYFFS